MEILNYKSVVVSIIALFLFSGFVAAETDVLDIIITEYVSQTIAYDQVVGGIDDEPLLLTEAPGEEGELRDGVSRTGVQLQDTMIYGEINISNVELFGGQTFVSINVTINNTFNITQMWFVSLPSYLTASNVNVSVDIDNPGSPSNISIFIPELRAGDSVIMNYTVEGTGVGEPLNFTEVYSFWRVMTGRTINITLNVTNSFIDDVEIYDLNMVKIPFPYTNVEGTFSYFEFTDLRGEDSSNALIFPLNDIHGTPRTVLEWNASDGILARGETRQIIFDATAPTNLSMPGVNWSDEDDWAMWMQIGNISADFKMNGSVSGLRLIAVESVPTDVRIAVTKERINESWYWNSSIEFRNDAVADVVYNLTQMTVWATQLREFSDPGDQSRWVQETNLTVEQVGPISVLTTANATWMPNLPWFSSVNRTNVDFDFRNYSILFNYSYVPIVWVDASFIVLDTETQYFKLNESRSKEGEYLFIEEIYVLLGGYLMKVTKELTPLEAVTPGVANRYMVNITLENVGTEQTPDLVTMFDMVPRDFNPRVFNTPGTAIGTRNMTAGSPNQVLRVTNRQGTWNSLYNSDYVLGAQDTGEIGSGTFEGYWGYNIDFAAINATSDGDGRYTPSLADKEIGIAYIIQGNHSLVRIENAYIVGVDPIRLEGASPSQSVASRLRMTTNTMEYVVVLASLLVSIALLSLGFVYSRKR